MPDLAALVGLQAVRRQDVGVGILAGAVLPAGLFNLFHMRAFILRGLTASDVAWAHSVYWAWNIANDVFAGYWIDRFCAAFGSRLPLVRSLSFIWTFVAVLPFFDLGLDPFVHYFVSIMLFDGCMTVVCIARGSLVAELGEDEQHRIGMGRVGVLCSIPEALVGMFALLLWDWPQAFRCLLLASVGLSLFFVEIGYRLCRPAARPIAAFGRNPQISMKAYLNQLRGQSNFWAFVGMNCVMEMQTTFHDQFNPVLADILSPTFSAVVLPLLGVFGYVTSYTVTLLADRVGTYWIYCCAIVGKIIVACTTAALVILGCPYNLVSLASMLLVQISMSAGCKFFDVSISNLADEYAVQSGVEVDVASRMMATHAVFAKPLNSVASVIATQVISIADYKAMKSANKAPTRILQDQAVRVLIGFPLVVGCLQWLAWRRFSLHGRELLQLQEYKKAAHSTSKT